MRENVFTIKASSIVFAGIIVLFSIALFSSLVLTTSTPLILITLPLVAYDRAFLFPIFMSIPLAQGAFITETVDVDTLAESVALASVCPLLLFDVLRVKSRTVPYRFVVFYIIFAFFVLLGLFVYYQHPENFKGMPAGTNHAKPILKSIIKIIKITFFFLYLKVLINYPVSTNIRTLEFSRKIAPFTVIMLGIYLLLYGRVQSGAAVAGQETLQMGDAHHGSFTSQLCSIGIFLYITLFKPKEKIWNKAIAVIAIIMMFIMIMQMGSRNGLVCFVLVSALGVYINIKNKRLDYQFMVLFVLGIVGAIGVVYSLSSPTIQRAIYMSTVEGGGNRWYYWDAGVSALTRNPFLGMGGDETASIAAVSKYAPGLLDDKVMHNSYLEMAVEYGLVGLVFYISFLSVILVWSYRLFNFALSKGDMLLTAPAVSYLILMFSALFVSRIWETAIWYNLTMVLALSIQLIYVKYTSRKNINTYSAIQHQLKQNGKAYPY